MGLQTQDFQGGAVGVPFSMSNSGLPSVNPNNTSIATYENLPAVDPIYGRTKGLRVSVPAGSTFDARFNAGASCIKAACQFLVWYTGTPSGGPVDIETMRGTVQNTGMRYMDTSGSFQHRPLVLGSNITGSGNYDVIGTAKWALVDHFVESEPTAAAGRVKWRWWDIAGVGGLTTPDFVVEATGQNAGDSDLHVIQTNRIGKLTAAPTMPDFYFADWRFDDTASDFLATPSGSVPDITGTHEVHHSVILDFTGFSGGAPGGLTAEVTQTGGPAVTLVPDPTNALLVTFDDVTRDVNLTFSYTVHDTGSKETDPATITVAPGTGLTHIIRVGPLVKQGGQLK